MSGVTNIKYLLIGNTDTIKIITEYIVIKNPQTQTEAKQIFEKLSKVQEKKIDQRNKIQGGQGNYYFTITAPNCFFLVLVDQNYPERFVFELIDAINKDHIPLMVNDKGELNASGRQILKNHVDNYQEAKNRISDVQNDVNEIQLEMKENIKKIITNVDDARNLQATSDRIKNNSADYKKNAKDLERATWWQNCKLTIIIASLVIGVILVIVLPIVLTKNKNFYFHFIRLEYYFLNSNKFKCK
jgi:hypothetical protein